MPQGAASPVPPGGLTGQRLTKLTDSDYETTWSDSLKVIGVGRPTAGIDLPQNSVWAEFPTSAVTVITTSQRLLRLDAFIQASVITAAVTSPNCGIASGNPVVPANGSNVLRMIVGLQTTTPVNHMWCQGGSLWVTQPASTVTYTLVGNGGGSTGTLRIAANGPTYLSVSDWGPG